MNLYEDNGHSREKLQRIAETYKPPSDDDNNNNNNNNNNKRKKKNNTDQAVVDAEIKALFDILPFSKERISDEERKSFACIKYIPEIAPQLKRVLKKAGVNVNFTSGTSLKDILCSRNKTHAPKNKKKGIYKYTCTCSEKAIYIGQTHRCCETRWKEHGRAITKEQWDHSGISQHYRECQEPFNTENFEVIHTMQDKKKGRLNYNLRMREAFEIRRHDSGPGRGLNEDNGAYLKTDLWDPVLRSL